MKEKRKTWIVDIDGVIFPHRAYLERREEDKPIRGSLSFLRRAKAAGDQIILMTARDLANDGEYTGQQLRRYKIPYDQIVWNALPGLRILINDKKPDGEYTAMAVNIPRNKGLSCLVRR